MKNLEIIYKKFIIILSFLYLYFIYVSNKKITPKGVILNSTISTLSLKPVLTIS